MNDAPKDFGRLMERVRTGCPEAARELFDEFGGHVRRIVRRKLDPRLRPQFDSTDFTQAVWASFFATPREQFAFDTPDALIGFLVGMASNKVAEAYRNRMRTAKRDPRREQALAAMKGHEASGPQDPGQPTPSKVAVANEEWELLQKDLSERYRLALDLLRCGHTHTEAAAKVGMNPKTLQRLLRRLRRAPAHVE